VKPTCGILLKNMQRKGHKWLLRKQREIVIKLSCKGMSIEEIASILEITEAHVRELADKKSA